MTSAIMGGALGMVFHGTAIAYLEQDTKLHGAGARRRHALHVWTVTATIRSRSTAAASSRCAATAVNQHGEVVATAEGRMLVARARGN